MQARQERPAKIYVEVRAIHTLDGRIIPTSFRAEEEDKVKIDRVLDVRRAASLKAGGHGIRYICLVGGKEIHLFHEEDRWFVEL